MEVVVHTPADQGYCVYMLGCRAMQLRLRKRLQHFPPRKDPYVHIMVAADFRVSAVQP